MRWPLPPPPVPLLEGDRGRGWRKVRTPQGREVANGDRPDASSGQGKDHRK